MKNKKKYYWTWQQIDNMIDIAIHNPEATLEYEFDDVVAGDNFRIFISNKNILIQFNDKDIWSEDISDFDGESAMLLIDIVEGRRAPFGDLIPRK